MAKVIPSGWRELEVAGAALREIETLATLESGLPEDLTVFHGVHWTRIDRGHAVFGEIDFVIVSPSARVLLVEQKSGFLSETADGLVKKYEGREKRVATQLARTLEALRRRLAPVVRNEPLAIDYLLYCPDYTVRHKGTAGIAPERIVDAPLRGELCRRIADALPAEPARDALAHHLRRFFADELQLVPDVSALVGRAERLVTRLAGGLAHWAQRLDFDPFRLRVVGTAGSGKTQLALSVLTAAAGAGRRALYVCFNRPLADHMAHIAPAAVEVASYHQLCDRRLRAAGQSIDYGRPGAFADMEARFAELAVGAEAQVDELVIDEGQDFQPAWKDALLRLVKPDGRAWWLEDPMQRLYDRPPVELPGWVTLTAETNYRSPRDVLGYINRLLQPTRPIEAASPFAGGEVEFLTYADAAQLVEATKRAVTKALQAGFRVSDTVVVTFSGREKSLLAPYDQLGPHQLKRWLGRYDLFGTPQFSEGDLLVETVYRFKGQSAPCVVLTEVDFDALDDIAQRKLFVGMTRASMKLIVVLSERAATTLLARIGAGEAVA
ncbi:MAG: ATP-binding domain-containing protein [Pseudomonadota bacterium]